MISFGSVRVAWIIGGTSDGRILPGSNKFHFDLPFTPEKNNAASVFASLIGTGSANVDNFTDVNVLPAIDGKALTVNAYNSGQSTVVNASVSLCVMERLSF